MEQQGKTDESLCSWRFCMNVNRYEVDFNTFFLSDTNSLYPFKIFHTFVSLVCRFENCKPEFFAVNQMFDTGPAHACLSKCLKAILESEQFLGCLAVNFRSTGWCSGFEEQSLTSFVILVGGVSAYWTQFPQSFDDQVDVWCKTEHISTSRIIEYRTISGFPSIHHAQLPVLVLNELHDRPKITMHLSYHEIVFSGVIKFPGDFRPQIAFQQWNRR